MGLGLFDGVEKLGESLGGLFVFGGETKREEFLGFIHGGGGFGCNMWQRKGFFGKVRGLSGGFGQKRRRRGGDRVDDGFVGG